MAEEHAPPPARVPALAPLPFHRPAVDAALLTVCAAWEDGRKRGNADHVPLFTALDAPADAARAERVTVFDLTEGVDARIGPGAAGAPALDADLLRQHAGARLIRHDYGRA